MRKKIIAPTESTIYVGPSIPGGRLSTFTVFKNGNLMHHVEQLLVECKAIKSLIVPVSKLTATQQKLKDSSSVEAARYQEVQKTFRTGA
jgi:hypothetical protein